MSAAIGALQRRGRLSYDTTIGLLFVAMLSSGIIVVSHSRSFATDATTILFGDILAIRAVEIVTLACALMITLSIATTFHRSFVASAFDPRIAHTLGLRPRLAQVMLVALVTLAVVASYQAVGTLLVVALLLGPVVAAHQWTGRIPSTMLLATRSGSRPSPPASSPHGTPEPRPAPRSRSAPSRWPWRPRSLATHTSASALATTATCTRPGSSRIPETNRRSRSAPKPVDLNTSRSESR